MNKKQVIKVTALAVGLSAMMVLTTACSDKTEEVDTLPAKVDTNVKEKVEKETKETETKERKDQTKVEGSDGTEEVTNAKVDADVKDGYTLDAEEPGRFILQNNQFPAYFSRIEVLGSNVDVAEIKEETMMALDVMGGAEDLSDSLGNTDMPKFYDNAEFFLTLSNEEGNQNIILKKVNDMYLKINVFYANEEASEGITPQMLDILSTINVTK